MEIVMNNLTQDKLDTIFKDGKNISGKPIYIDFYADWWGPCRMFKQVLEDVSPDYENKINMYAVDIEEEIELAAALGARALPYMIFISDDGGVTPVAGAMDSDTFKYYLDGLLTKGKES